MKETKSKIYNNNGNIKARSGDYYGAIFDYNEAILINPEVALYYFNRGIVKAQVKDFDGALNDFNKTLEIDPNYEYVHDHIATIKDIQESPRKRISDIEKTQFLNLVNFARSFEKGIENWKSGDYKSSIDNFNNAIKIDPSNSAAFFNRGIAKGKSGDFQGSIDDFNKALELDPNNLEIYINRGVAKGKLDDHLGAIMDYSIVIQINPKIGKAYAMRAAAKIAVGQNGYDDFIQAEKLGF